MGGNKMDYKKLTFSISYQSLFTLFPQLWKNDSKNKVGKLMRINFAYLLVTNINNFY